ncbi:MAG: YciI family protein [Pseudomonadota bacterium]
MLFAFVGYDKPNSLNLRMDNRPAHVEWLKSNPIPIAGPLLDDDGNPCGSIVICEAESLEEAARIFATDPYAEAGLFEKTDLRPWKWVIGAPE